jgi:hypothetical protein
VEPVILVHGYSSESAKTTPEAVRQIYGSLPDSLAGLLGPENVIPVNVSRYITLDDGISIDDLSLAMDRVIKKDFPNLLDSGFNAIVHSTGALVTRNWVRRHSPRPSPLKRIIYLAGANHGSGWAHIGESLVAKWFRLIAQRSQRGLAVLNALELGSSWTIDLHRFFLQYPWNDMLESYRILEFNLIGSQVPAEWAIIPIRYGKEDGADGAVRTSSTSLNHAYIHLCPTQTAYDISWDDAKAYAKVIGKRRTMKSKSVLDDGFYEVCESSIPGTPTISSEHPENIVRKEVPFALVYECAHSSETVGIVYGSKTRESVLSLIKTALETSLETASVQSAIERFRAETTATYDKVRSPEHQERFQRSIQQRFVAKFFNNPYAQYDGHAQVVIRVRDQLGKPVNDFSVYFNSIGGDRGPSDAINSLFEDKHKNIATPNCITFYLRLTQWDEKKKDWIDRLPGINGVDLEIDGVDRVTGRALYLPLRMRIDSELLCKWLRPHRTTILDVELMRIASNDTFMIY